MTLSSVCYDLDYYNLGFLFRSKYFEPHYFRIHSLTMCGIQIFLSTSGSAVNIGT